MPKMRGYTTRIIGELSGEEFVVVTDLGEQKTYKLNVQDAVLYYVNTQSNNNIVQFINEHEAEFNHDDIVHDNRAALDLVSGTNTGDQDLSPYELIANLGTAAYTASTAYDVAGAATSAISAHIGAYAHGDIAHSNRAALDLVSGTNTGDQDLSPYELIANLGTAAYTASTDYDATGTATSVMSSHTDTYVHGDIAHSNRTYLDNINQDLITTSNVTFNDITVTGSVKNATFINYDEKEERVYIVGGVVSIPNTTNGNVFYLYFDSNITSWELPVLPAAGTSTSFLLKVGGGNTSATNTWTFNRAVKWMNPAGPMTLLGNVGVQSYLAFTSAGNQSAWLVSYATEYIP